MDIQEKQEVVRDKGSSRYNAKELINTKQGKRFSVQDSVYRNSVKLNGVKFILVAWQLKICNIGRKDVNGATATFPE